MFNLIGQPRFNSPLVRFFGMKIPGAAAPTLAPEIAPSFEVNQQDDPAMFFLRGERRAAAHGTVVAAVGNYSAALLRNPTGSGIIITAEYTAGEVANACVANIILVGADYAVNVSNGPLDTRWLNSAGGYVATGRVSSQNTSAIAPGGFPVERFYTGGQGHWIGMRRVVLTPGTGLVLYPTNTNLAFGFTFSWTERKLPVEEAETG